MARRKKDKPKKGVKAIGRKRDGYIWRTTVGGVHERERCVNIARCPKSGKRARFSTLKGKEKY